MIDIKFLRENPDAVKENIKKKFQDSKLPLVDEVIELDAQLRKAQQRGDSLRADRNRISKEIGGFMAKGQKDEAEKAKAQVKEFSDELAALEKQEEELSEKVKKIMMTIPNIIDPSVPIGKDDSENVEIEKFGEPVVPDVTFSYSETTDLMVGKSFDCRLGCAAILKTMHTLAGQELNVDIVGACAAQEEVGVRGATVTSQVIKPDVAIVFEGCPADDTCVEPYMVQTAIKHGPMLRHIDARMITNPRYQRYALGLAEELGIPVQDAVRSAGSTNGAAIHLTEKAVPVIVIGVPVRYAHTHYGISAYADFDNAVKLACEILKRLDEKLIMSF